MQIPSDSSFILIVEYQGFSLNQHGAVLEEDDGYRFCLGSQGAAANHMNHNGELLQMIYLRMHSLFYIVGRSEVDREIHNGTYIGG